MEAVHGDPAPGGRGRLLPGLLVLLALFLLGFVARLLPGLSRGEPAAARPRVPAPPPALGTARGPGAPLPAPALAVDRAPAGPGADRFSGDPVGEPARDEPSARSDPRLGGGSGPGVEVVPGEEPEIESEVRPPVDDPLGPAPGDDPSAAPGTLGDAEEESREDPAQETGPIPGDEESSPSPEGPAAPSPGEAPESAAGPWLPESVRVTGPVAGFTPAQNERVRKARDLLGVHRAPREKTYTFEFPASLPALDSMQRRVLSLVEGLPRLPPDLRSALDNLQDAIDEYHPGLPPEGSPGPRVPGDRGGE